MKPHRNKTKRSPKMNFNNIQFRGTQPTYIFPYIFHFQGEPLLDAFKKWRNWADEKVCCDYSLHMAITYWNDSVAEQMKTICSEEIGINSFKCFMAYKDMMMLRDDELLEVFKVCRNIGALAQVHAENGDVIAENQQRLLSKGVTGPEGHPLSRYWGPSTYKLRKQARGRGVSQMIMLLNKHMQ